MFSLPTATGFANLETRRGVSSGAAAEYGQSLRRLGDRGWLSTTTIAGVLLATWHRSGKASDAAGAGWYNTAVCSRTADPGTTALWFSDSAADYHTIRWDR
mmetsp:Transcript_29012/g.45510  ORF Transcript_29012/g.45510 Transcript_29012/m.45510 type:complete len:101 (+) Transcript_29012:291-593(+)